MSLELRILAAANCYKAALRSAYGPWRQAVRVLDSQIAAWVSGSGDGGFGGCAVSSGDINKLLRAKSLSLALLAAIGEGIEAADTEVLVKAQNEIAQLTSELKILLELNA